ncbi:MAG: RNA polymerase sigma factor [Planctomycetota bacterium]|nr:MAG: RNA polymerase sigma factor [Planctomycetota bacterium]
MPADPHATREPTAPADDPGSSWMLAYKHGDERAFDRLVEHYSPQVFALVTRFWGTERGREDLVQEVFLRLVRTRARYEPTARFSTFLYRIVFNLCANQRERERLRPALSIDAPWGGGPDGDAREPAELDAPGPSDRIERDDVVGAVRAAIASLPATQRMALILAKYEELPYAEIAAILNSSEKAIKSMVHRARENLRERLAPFLAEESA